MARKESNECRKIVHNNRINLLMVFLNFQEIVKKCKQNASDHEDFSEKYASATKWLEDASYKYEACAALTSGRDDIEAKRAIIQVGLNFFRSCTSIPGNVKSAVALITHLLHLKTHFNFAHRGRFIHTFTTLILKIDSIFPNPIVLARH